MKLKSFPALQISQTLRVPVFPCSKSKRPLTPSGHKDATTDLSEIKGWWIKYPEANIGMPTGEASGFTVIDLDGGEKGEESFRNLGPIDQETIQVRTQSGGRHLWYLDCPEEEIRCDTGNKLGPYIDVKANGGYVLIPPSSTEIGSYEFIDGHAPWEIEPAPLPQLIIDKLIQKKKRTVHFVGPCFDVEQLLSPIPQGQRNVEMTRRIGFLISQYGPREEVLDLAWDLNLRCCVPPIDRRELESIFRSIRGREIRNA